MSKATKVARSKFALSIHERYIHMGDLGNTSHLIWFEDFPNHSQEELTAAVAAMVEKLNQEPKQC